jgi:hypothetical protein
MQNHAKSWEQSFYVTLKPVLEFFPVEADVDQGLRLKS